MLFNIRCLHVRVLTTTASKDTLISLPNYSYMVERTTDVYDIDISTISCESCIKETLYLPGLNGISVGGNFIDTFMSLGLWSFAGQ